ncbi:MAG: hypothetical protein ABI728_08470 [Betaproteobacteria bacterium]
MNRLLCLLAATSLLALTACATSKKAELERPPAASGSAQAPVAEIPIREKVVVPGERAGPILLGMSLGKLVGVVGEPVSSSASRIPSAAAPCSIAMPTRTLPLMALCSSW